MMKRFNKKVNIGLAVFVLIGTVFYLFSTHKVSASFCTWWGCYGGGSYINEQSAIESNQQNLDKIEQVPQLTDSLERKNLRKRAITFNNPNKISYIYLYSQAGVFIMYDTVKGKVSALDSSLTPQQQTVDYHGNVIDGQNNWCGSYGCQTVPAPAVDGSYGTNGNGIFWYNESGAYREWNGIYLVSDEPFSPQTPANLVSGK